MKRNSRLALLVLALCAMPQLAQAGTWHKSLAPALAEAKKSNKLIFVDMYAEWCGWCKKMEREVFPTAEFQAFAKNYVLLRLDTEDRKEGTTLSREWNVGSLPTFVLLTHEQMIAGLIRGYAPTDEFVKRVELAEQAYLDFLKRARSEPASATERQRLDLTKELIERRSFTMAESKLAKLAQSLNNATREEALYTLAFSYSRQGKHDKAAATAKQALAVSGKGEFGERSQLLIAQTYLEQQNYPAALVEYKRFKTNYPKSPFVSSVDIIVPQLEQAIAQK